MATSNLKIAIAVPIGAWSPLFKSCLESIMRQDADYELAILDASDDPRVEADIQSLGIKPDYHRKGKDAGQTAAINEGWDNIGGGILAWLNTDDILLDGVLSEISGHFTGNPDLDVFYGDSTISDINGHIIGLHPEVEAPSALLYRSNIISQPSCFFRRIAVDAVGGLNNDLHYTMDWDLWVRLMEAGHTFEYTPRVLSNVTWGFDTKTSRFNLRRIRELRGILRRHHGLYTVSKSLFGFMQHYLATYFGGGKSTELVKSLASPIVAGTTIPALNLSEAVGTVLNVEIITQKPVIANIAGNEVAFYSGLNSIDCQIAPLGDLDIKWIDAPDETTLTRIWYA